MAAGEDYREGCMLSQVTGSCPAMTQLRSSLRARSRITLIAASASLIVVTVILSTSVLLSVRSSAKRFPDDDRPQGLLFHPADTIRNIQSFPQFRALIEGEHYGQVLEQAEVELWLATRHYVFRYAKLRGAIIAFRGAAIIFACVLTVSVVVNLVLRS